MLLLYSGFHFLRWCTVAIESTSHLLGWSNPQVAFITNKVTVPICMHASKKLNFNSAYTEFHHCGFPIALNFAPNFQSSKGAGTPMARNKKAKRAFPQP